LYRNQIHFTRLKFIKTQPESLITVGKFEMRLEHANQVLKYVLKAQDEGDDPGHRPPQAYNEVAEAYCTFAAICRSYSSL
jgi:hypothetical protein